MINAEQQQKTHSTHHRGHGGSHETQEAHDMSNEPTMKNFPVDAFKKVLFEFSAEPGSHVFVAGTFNNWNPTANPMKLQARSGCFVTSLQVPHGTHEYLFVVNNAWMTDPKRPDAVPNPFGGSNSLLHV